MDNAEDEEAGISGTVEQGNGARVEKAKKQQSFMEKLIGVRNAQCEMYLATVNRVLDKHASHNLRAIQANTNQLKYDYKCMQVSQQQNELAARQRADPDIDLEYEEFLIRQTQKYLIYNPNNCCYTDKSLRYPPRSSIHTADGPVSPALSKARKVLQETTLSKHKSDNHDHRNVRFRIAEPDDQHKMGHDLLSKGGPESTFTSIPLSSNPDAGISPDPDKLFLPPQKAPDAQEVTMEQFRKRLHMRHSLETMKLAPYKVLLDENKAAKTYPDPFVVKNGDLEQDQTWLPAIYRRSQTSTPNIPTDPSKFRSRSDTFFQESRDTSATPRLSNLSAKAARKTTFSDGTLPAEKHKYQQSLTSRNSAKSIASRPTTTKSTRTIKTRPVTHAMLKREKTELNLKLGTFLHKLDEEKRQISRPTSKGINVTTFENIIHNPTDQQNSPHQKLKTKVTLSSSKAASANQSNSTTLKTSQTSDSIPKLALNNKPLVATSATSTPRRGFPSHAANRSQRHNATEKLRRVVAALVKNRSKVEMMQMDTLRVGDGGNTEAVQTEAVQTKTVASVDQD